MSQATLFQSEPVPAEKPLPDLIGSEKQVPWAAQVRAGKLRACREHLRQWSLLISRYEDAGRDDQAEQERAGYRAAVDILAVLEGQNACRFWIDRRQNSAAELLVLAAAKPGNSW